MELMDVLYQRRSTRAFTAEPVPRATIETLLAAAVQAPTGMNAQPWAFGVIEGRARLRAYSDRAKAWLLAHLDQLPLLERYRAGFANPDFNIFWDAPACVLVFAKPTGATPEQDCAMAAYAFMLAACDAGLGTCWIGFASFLFGQPEVLAELGVPAGYRLIAPLALGFPRGAMPAVEKAAPEVIFWQE